MVCSDGAHILNISKLRVQILTQEGAVLYVIPSTQAEADAESPGLEIAMISQVGGGDGRLRLLKRVPALASRNEAKGWRKLPYFC